ncbi:MAG TPA: glycosyltransferase [Roseomonas sp.]|jgi:glycosyltransferase involved in cell wall biosynthesis
MIADGLAPPPRWPETPSPFTRWTLSTPPRHVHLLPSLSLGGAERIVADLAGRFAQGGIPAGIIVLRDAPSEHAIPGPAPHRLGTLPWPERLARAAALIHATGLPAYCHLTSLPELEALWQAGCRTIPVVHNAPAGWATDPIAWCRPEVPFVLACGERVAAALRAHAPGLVIRALRHPVAPPPPMEAARRRAIRAALGADDATPLIGMVGRIVPQKRHDRAAAILAALSEARLAIIGATRGPDGHAARAVLEAEAARLGVRGRITIPGPVADAGALMPAFDLLLNTSSHEGVSIASMEAVAAGVPVVSADVGGQAEALGSADALLPPDAPAIAWRDAIRAGLARPVTPPPDTPWLRAAQAALWPWLAALGPGASLPEPRCDILFATANLDAGGAQRSLCNLAGELARQGLRITVAILGPAGVPGLAEAAAGARILHLDGEGGLAGRAGRLLALARAEAPRWLVFWNVDPETKLMAATTMAGGPVRLADVSPGPLLHAEMARRVEVARAFTTSPDGYFAALDLLVEKHAGGARPCIVIPNGVPLEVLSLPPGDGPAPPAGCDPTLAVVVLGRLVPDKRPELLAPLARALALRLPGASLTVVGGLHDGADDAGWRRFLDGCGARGMPENLHLSGPDHRAGGFLPRFAALALASRNQGSPNTVLEAMAAGLPVVANPDGGTAAMILDGVTGHLLPDGPDLVAAMADRLAGLLADPPRRAAMGRAARARAAACFSMPAMAAAYRSALGL